MYAIMMECDSGTTRLIDDCLGCRWETVFHTITWVVEDTLEAAQAALKKTNVDGRWTIAAWIAPYDQNRWNKPDTGVKRCC